MINASSLLRDLKGQKGLVAVLEADIRERIHKHSALDESLTAEWQAAKDAARTAQTLHDFKEEAVTQAAVHWILMGVFVRFLEDNGLLDRPYLSAADPQRRALALDRHETYFRAHPGNSDREYLLACFHEVANLPGMAALFDERHNPLWRLPVSGDGAMALLGFWQKVEPDTGKLARDFTDPDWDTRFLGDLYQDLSEAAQKRYALLQTPEFVEEFILDRSLEPALREFGYREVRLIDPTCGSGHFLLGAFRRLLDQWQRNEPARIRRDTVQKALDGVYGVDLNPFAVAIARFRLLIAALAASGERHLAEAPNFRFNLAVGDSLLHGPQKQADLFMDSEHFADTSLAHVYAVEDLDELNRILGQAYHAVVGNPPYITVKDAALNKAYRDRYPSCHRQYSLGVPFTERFFELATNKTDSVLETESVYGLVPKLPLGNADREAPASQADKQSLKTKGSQAGAWEPASAMEPAISSGYVGMITANSFMKREFGKKLIEQFFPRIDLTHVIDTAGAYIPGHGTPTVILLGRNRPPVISSIRTVMGIKGEPSTPANPAQGLVWSAIVNQVDNAGSESAFVSVADTPRTNFGKHPWSIGGGGAADLKEMIEEARIKLETQVDSIGFASFTGSDEVFSAPLSSFRRKQFPFTKIKDFVLGDTVRDWSINLDNSAFAPYQDDLSPMPYSPDEAWGRALWMCRTTLGGVFSFGGKTRKECGDLWWTWYRWVPGKYATPLSITFASVATHNHFVLDRGGKVFKQSAPVIKLPAGANEDEHLALLGLLNSSVACFWMKQVCHDKGNGGIGGGIASEGWERFHDFTATKLAEFPIPPSPQPFPPKNPAPLAPLPKGRGEEDNASLSPSPFRERGWGEGEIARRLDQLAQEYAACLPANLFK